MMDCNRSQRVRTIILVAGFLLVTGVVVVPVRFKQNDFFVQLPELHLATWQGDLQAVDELLAMGHDPNEHFDVPDSRVPVHQGAPVPAWLLDSTPLITAVGMHNLDIANLLLDRGADVNLQSTRNGMAPLHFACKNGDSEVVTFLVDKGASIAETSLVGLAPLSYAAYSGDVETVKILIKHGADPNATTPDGYTALMSSSKQKSGPVVAALLSAGADPNDARYLGRTALMIHAVDGGRDSIVELIAGGADVWAKSDDGQTALDLAISGMWGEDREEVLAILRTAMDNASDGKRRPEGSDSPDH